MKNRIKQAIIFCLDNREVFINPKYRSMKDPNIPTEDEGEEQTDNSQVTPGED